MIITIGRESGSGGQRIGQLLAKKLNIAFYDTKELQEKAKEYHVFDELSTFLDENPVDSLLYTIAMEASEGTVDRMPYAFLNHLVEGGDFVLMGRGGNDAFHSNPDAISLFIHASEENRIKRIMETEQLSMPKAKKKIHSTDDARRRFHEYYTGQDWGQSKNYDLCIDSGVLGIEKTAELIYHFISLACK